MADNQEFVDSVASYIAATDKVTYSDDANVDVQLVRFVGVTGSEGSKTVVSMSGTAGSAAAGVVTVQGVASMTPVATTNPACSIKHLVVAATDNATNVKASAGTLYGGWIFNKAAYPVYLKFHNTAGSPTAGSGVILAVPAQAGTLTPFTIPQGGFAFATGIAITVIKDIADNGTTAVASADATLEVFYA